MHNNDCLQTVHATALVFIYVYIFIFRLMSDHFSYKGWELLTVGLSQDVKCQLHHAAHLPRPHRLL